MIGNDFKYGNEWLSEYGLIMCEAEEGQQFVSRNIIKEEITALDPSPSHYNVAYNDALVQNFFVMKEAGLCGNQEDSRLSGDDIHFIRSWLESPKRPEELIVPIREDEMTVHYYGLFTDVQPYLHNDECYGLLLTFTCNAPYGYSDENISSYSINSSANPVLGTFFNLSAELEEYLKPTITIYSSDVFGDDESITITNTSDNGKEMSVTLPSGLSKIVIDCDKKIITGDDGELVTMSDIGVTLPTNQDINVVSTELYLFNWFTLIPKDNSLIFTPSTTNTIDRVEISVRYIIKAGGF